MSRKGYIYRNFDTVGNSSVQKVILRKCENEILISTLTLIMAFTLSSAQPTEHEKYSAGILSRKHFTQGNKI
jgi:hypothetical protein